MTAFLTHKIENFKKPEYQSFGEQVERELLYIALENNLALPGEVKNTQIL